MFTVLCKYSLPFRLWHAVPILVSLYPSGGAGWVRAAVRIPKLWGSHTLNGVSHNEGVGGCSLGGVEHRGFNLWLHSHQCHGRAHSLTGECYNHPPVCHRPSVGCTCGSLHLHSAKEELTQDTDTTAVNVGVKLCSAQLKGILTCLTFTQLITY